MIDEKELKEKLKKILPEVLREGLGEHTYYLTADTLHISAATPKVQLEGTETGAKNLSLRENAGVIELYDEGAAARVALPIAIIPPDIPQTGLDATATGVKWTSVVKLKIDPARVNSVTLRATWTASDTDSVTAIEVYDITAAAVLGSVSGNTGTDVEGTITGFTAGNLVTLRANVTTASAATAASTDVTYCLLELDLEV